MSAKFRNVIGAVLVIGLTGYSDFSAAHAAWQLARGDRWQVPGVPG
jgi:hypothetical protein